MRTIVQSRSVGVGIVNYNGESTLVPTLESVFRQDYPAISEVMLADNRSTDRSLEVLRQTFSDRVRILPLDANRGPNPARNAILRAASSGLVLVMDNDIILAPDYISRLAAVLAEHPDAGVASGQIRSREKPDEVQYSGAFIHYAGEVVLNPAGSDTATPVGAVSAGAALFDREKAFAAGGFDEDFFFGWEDGDLTYRMGMAGCPCWAVPPALCYHMKGAREMKWIRFQVRNRWWFILKHYDLRTLLLALPAILFYQSAAGMFLILKGKGGSFLLGSWDALRTLGRVWKKRREILPIKKTPDSQTLCGGALALHGRVQERGLTRVMGGVVNAVLAVHWRLIRRFIR